MTSHESLTALVEKHQKKKEKKKKQRKQEREEKKEAEKSEKEKIKRSRHEKTATETGHKSICSSNPPMRVVFRVMKFRMMNVPCALDCIKMIS